MPSHPYFPQPQPGDYMLEWLFDLYKQGHARNRVFCTMLHRTQNSHWSVPLTFKMKFKVEQEDSTLPADETGQIYTLTGYQHVSRGMTVRLQFAGSTDLEPFGGTIHYLHHNEPRGDNNYITLGSFNSFPILNYMTAGGLNYINRTVREDYAFSFSEPFNEREIVIPVYPFAGA